MWLDWVHSDNPGLSSLNSHILNYILKAHFSHVRKHVHVFQKWEHGYPHGGWGGVLLSHIWSREKKINFLTELHIERPRLIKDNLETMAIEWPMILWSRQWTHYPLLFINHPFVKRVYFMRWWVENIWGLNCFNPLVLYKRKLV